MKALYEKLRQPEFQKKQIEDEILAIRQELERQSPFSKADKIRLFRQLFIGNEQLTHYKSPDGVYVAIVKNMDEIISEVPAHMVEKNKYLSPSLFRKYNE